MRIQERPKKATVTVALTIAEPKKPPRTSTYTFYTDECSEVSIAQDWVDIDDTPLGQPYRGRKRNGRTHFKLSITNAKKSK